MPQDALPYFVAGLATGIGAVVVVGLPVLLVLPWLRMVLGGGRGSLVQVMAMRLRGNPPRLIVEAFLSLLHGGARVTLRDVESHYIANRARILTAADLVESIQEDPVQTHAPVWLGQHDLEWLARHCEDKAAELGEAAPCGAAAEEADRCHRIAQGASAACWKMTRGGRE